MEKCYSTSNMDKIININWKWEEMCGPEGLQPWNNTAKDFGYCFQEIFLQIPVYFLIAIISGYYVGYRRDWVVREKTNERAIVLRSFVVLVLAVIPIIEMYILITKLNSTLLPADYLVAGGACLSWLVHFAYVLALKHRLGLSSRGPVVQLTLWALTVVLTLLALRTKIISGKSTSFIIGTFCCHVLYFITLIPSKNSRPTFYSPCLVGSQHSHVSIYLLNTVESL